MRILDSINHTFFLFSFCFGSCWLFSPPFNPSQVIDLRDLQWDGFFGGLTCQLVVNLCVFHNVIWQSGSIYSIAKQLGYQLGLFFGQVAQSFLLTSCVLFYCAISQRSFWVACEIVKVFTIYSIVNWEMYQLSYFQVCSSTVVI